MNLPTTHYDNSFEVKNATNRFPSSINESDVKTGGKNLLEKISTYVFLVTVFLAPLAFIPSAYTPLDLVKNVVIGVGVLLSCILYSVSSLKYKTISFPHHALAYSAIAIMASLTISSFFSSNISKSVFGQGFESGTASFLILMFVVSFLVTRLVTKSKDISLNIYVTIFLSFIILALFHIARFIGGYDFMTLGILSSAISTVVGRWYDFAIISGFVGLISFFGIKFLSIGKRMKLLFIITFVISASILFIINSGLIWGAFALIIFAVMVYEYYTRVPQGNGLKKFFSRLSFFSLIILVIAIVCIWKGDMLSGSLARALNVEQREVVLPWQMTLDVASDTLKESPYFGAGPNRFGYQFLRFKPIGINSTSFWNSEFVNGFGTLPTFIVTQGFIGAILWILFLVFFVRDGIRILKKENSISSKFMVISSFFTASFLWIMNIIYTPSHVVIFMTFIFTGLFIAMLRKEEILHEKEIGYMKESKARRYTPIIISLFIVFLILWLGVYVKKTVAVAFFQKGIKELNVNKSIDNAQAKFQKALAWNTSDVYYQALSETNIIKISSLVQDLQNQSVSNPSLTPDSAKVQNIKELIDLAVKYTNDAIAVDSSNYYNYVAQARVYEIGVALKMENAYENAKSAYVNALKINPYNPLIYLNLARLESSQGKSAEAKQFIGNALQLKNNYTEAVYFLSQIQLNDGQIKEAIISSQVATELNPNEPILFFQLGLLHYNDKNYSSAIIALEKAVKLNSQYANARYFLGLSYARLGQNKDAITQFEELAKSNPDNQEVAFILSNLRDGKSPFTDAKPPIDNKPEKRKALPVTEKNTSSKVNPVN